MAGSTVRASTQGWEARLDKQHAGTVGAAAAAAEGTSSPPSSKGIGLNARDFGAVGDGVCTEAADRSWTKCTGRDDGPARHYLDNGPRTTHTPVMLQLECSSLSPAIPSPHKKAAARGTRTRLVMIVACVLLSLWCACVLPWVHAMSARVVYLQELHYPCDNPRTHAHTRHTTHVIHVCVRACVRASVAFPRSQALQRAMDAALHQGRALYVPAGVYMINHTLVVRKPSGNASVAKPQPFLSTGLRMVGEGYSALEQHFRLSFQPTCSVV